MRTRIVTIPANGSSGVLGFAGNYLRVEEAGGPFFLRMDNRAYVEIDQGIEAISPHSWEHIELENKNASPITVKMVIGETDKFTIRSFRVVGTVDVDSGTSVQSLDDVTAAQGQSLLIAANANRKELLISGLSTNTDTVRVGGVTAAANNGQPIAPGGGAVLTTKGAVYVHNPNAADQVLTLVEVLQ